MTEQYEWQPLKDYDYGYSDLSDMDQHATLTQTGAILRLREETGGLRLSIAIELPDDVRLCRRVPIGDTSDNGA